MTSHATRHTFFRLLQLASPFKKWMLLSVLLGTLTIGSSIGLMAAAAWIIASAALHPSVADLAVAIVGVRFFGIARGVFRYLERLVSHHVNFSLLARLRVWFYTAIEPLAPARLAQYRSGDLLSRIVGDIETLQNFFIRVIAPPIVALLIAIGMGVFLAAFSPAIALAVLACMALVGGVVPIVVRRISRDAGQQLVLVRSELNTQLIDGLQGAADLIAFGQAHHQAARVKTLSREFVRWQGRMASITALHNACGALLTNLALGAVLLIAIPLVNAAQIKGVDLAVLALATLSSFEGVLALPLAFQYLETNLQAANRLFEIAAVQSNENLAKGSLKRSEQVTQPAHTRRNAPAPSGPPTHGVGHGLGCQASQGYSLVVKDLSFRYNAAEPLALDRLSFDLQPGRSLAIVGPSGAGKSTLINLLLRFWDYEQGHIEIGGRNLHDVDPDEARRLFGVVSQQTHLFNTTVRENLLLAKPEAADAEIIQSAQQAQLHDFIQSLPQGYATLIGEQGLRLSGGERQRLAIARALLKGAPILILDEATANLDPITEHEVLRVIRAAMSQRTTLMITHRLVGLEEADEILVLRAGRVVERGRQDELLQIDGLYRRMWHLQHQTLIADIQAG